MASPEDIKNEAEKVRYETFGIIPDIAESIYSEIDID